MILPAFVSAFCKAVGPRNRGPASSTATVSPCAAIRSATRAPVAPAPTISTSNVGVKSCENESPRIRAPYQNPESRARTLRATLRCILRRVVGLNIAHLTLSLKARPRRGSQALHAPIESVKLATAYMLFPRLCAIWILRISHDC